VKARTTGKSVERLRTITFWGQQRKGDQSKKGPFTFHASKVWKWVKTKGKQRPQPKTERKMFVPNRLRKRRAKGRKGALQPLGKKSKMGDRRKKGDSRARQKSA